MSCVVGLINGNTVYLGADSGTFSGWHACVRKDPKVFIRGQMAIGCVGSPRVNNLLRYQLDLPEHPEGMGAKEYLVRYFVESVRSCLKDGGCVKKDNEVEEVSGYSALLIGYHGRLFEIDADYQVGEPDSPFYAIGCGAPWALGCMTAMWDGYNPEYALEKSLEVAKQWCSGVREPWVIVKI